MVGWSEWSEYLEGRIGQVGRDDRDQVLGMIKVINLALVSGVVRGSCGTRWSEWLGMLSLDVMHSEKYMVCKKKREKS